MIIEFAENGRITHVVDDPVPPAILRMLLDSDRRSLVIEPKRLPEQFLFDRNGDPIMETVEQPILDGNDQPVLDHKGNPKIAIVEQQMFGSPGVEPIELDIIGSYVVEGQVVPRPIVELPAEIDVFADGVDEAVIELPADPCRLLVDGEEMMVDGGELSIVSDMPAEYTIRIDHFPFMPHTIKVTANAPDA